MSTSIVVCVQELAAEDVPVLQSWQGDYPVSSLDLLPKVQRHSHLGYIGELGHFEDIWKVLKPNARMPVVDFKKNIVLFYRNVSFYNKAAMGSVVIKDAGLDVLVRETMTSMPIEDKVFMVLALIPRTEALYLISGKERVPIVPSLKRDEDALNLSYTIEGNVVSFKDGLSVMDARAHSNSDARSMIIASPVSGDMDGDGDDDLSLFILHQTGGSGSFYYVAVAKNESGTYLGSNALYLGDRVRPKDLVIKEGALHARYFVRHPGEPMSSRPSILKTTVFYLQNGKLIQSTKSLDDL